MTSLGEKQSSVLALNEEIKKLYQDVTGQLSQPDDSSVLHLQRIVAFLYGIIQQMPGHVYWLDRNNIYLGCNDVQAENVNLKSPNEIRGKRNQDLPWFAQASELNKINTQVMETRQSDRVEEFAITKKHPDGGYYFSEKKPLLNENGDVIGVLGVSLDITELKRAQKELEQAKAKAEEAYEILRKFIQNMQHDMRTPLSGIYDYLKDKAAKEEDPEERMLYQYMANCSGQLLNMCNEIVDFDNAHYISNEIRLTPVDVRRLLHRVIDLYNAAAHMRGIKLKLDIDADVPVMLKMDKRRVIHTIENLTGNAIKFTDEGAVTIMAHLLELNGDKAKIAFEVHDTGMGIPKNKLSMIFEKFVKLNPSNQAKYKGSGLGLSYVQKFVEDLHGKIEVESEEGKGSIFRIIFTFSLPLPEEKEVFAEKEIDTFDEDIALREINKLPDEKFNKKRVVPDREENSPLSTNPPKNINAPQLLLIEDDLILQKTIAKRFKENDCHVVATVDSVSKACEAIKNQKYDLVVCDLGIHEGTGVDVMNWVKQDKSHPNQETPFVVLTANADPVTQQKALDSGFLEIFQKPLEIAAAKKIVDTYTGDRKITDTLNIMIIDIDASLTTAIDMDMVKEIFAMLNEFLLTDKKTLQACYEENNIQKAVALLMRLDGTFRSCVVPQLEISRAKLINSIKQAQRLTTITPLFNDFYHEIDIFREEYAKFKREGRL